MEERESARYRAKRHKCGGESGDSKRFFTLDDARDAHEKIKCINKRDLATPGKITDIPYLGIGEAPERLGGNIKFLGREEFEELVKDFLRSRCKRNILKGCTGIGKSYYLRGYAAGVMRDAMQQTSKRKGKLRMVCLWELKSAIKDLAEALRNALMFAYCKEDPALADIQNRSTVSEILDFIRAMREQGDRFCFILDGAEILGSYHCPALDELAKLGVHYYGVSPRAEMAEAVERKRDGQSIIMSLQRGFFGAELTHYMQDLSVLGKISAKFPQCSYQIQKFAGRHPLFLSILDRCFREVARTKVDLPGLHDLDDMYPAAEDDDQGDEDLNAEQVVKHIEDVDDFNHGLELFRTAAELTTIRVSLQHLLANATLQGEVRSIDDMVKLDSRYVLFPEGGPEYCTPYIHQIYLEEFRAREERLFYQDKGAWAAYCKYLLENDLKVNWSGMGWLCEKLGGDVIKLKGIRLDDIRVDRIAVCRSFTAIPPYESWISLVEEKGNGVLFLPVNHNYKAIDGVLIWCDYNGVLHFIALQFTVNAEDHQASAKDFMNLNIVERWLPNILQEKHKWKLHYAFICLQNLNPEDVDEDLKQIRAGILYGTLGYMKHTVSFDKAFEDYVDDTVRTTLMAIVKKREELAATVQSQPRQSVPQAAQPLGGNSESVIRGILSAMDKKKLQQVSRTKLQLDPDEYHLKEDLVDAIMAKLKTPKATSSKA